MEVGTRTNMPGHIHQRERVQNNDRKFSSQSNEDTAVQGHNPGSDSVSFPSDDNNLKFAEEAGASQAGTANGSMASSSQQEAVKLPQTFCVKYLGKREARGLWGIKHTRKPVDEMVTAAKNLKPGVSLPFVQFQVNAEGVTVSELPQNSNKNFDSGFYPVDIISYGVQDLIYTRVFAMIVVREATVSASGTSSPFECYAYVCDSRQSARRLTIALASAFQEFGKTVKDKKLKPKRVAIDLRTPEELVADTEEQETEA